MRVEELRIGNYLLGYDNNYFTWYYEHYDLCSKGIYADELGMPIELTEEILLKCGFKKKDHLFRLHLVNSIYIEFNSECNLWYFDIYMNTSRIELQYLHELQNIYSSITFKELEINL